LRLGDNHVAPAGGPRHDPEGVRRHTYGPRIVLEDKVRGAGARDHSDS